MVRLIFFLVSIIIVSCDTVDRGLQIKNLSNETVICYITANDSFPLSMDINSKPYYLRNLPDLKPYYHEDFISPSETKNEELINDKWINYVNRADNKKLRAWFFRKTLFDTTDWKLIVDKKNCDVKIALDENDLNGLNWEIAYPLKSPTK